MTKLEELKTIEASAVGALVAYAWGFLDSYDRGFDIPLSHWQGLRKAYGDYEEAHKHLVDYLCEPTR
jgi:hypothetical protein